MSFGLSLVLGGLGLISDLSSQRQAREQAQISYAYQRNQLLQDRVEQSRDEIEDDIAETRRIARIRLELGAFGFAGSSQIAPAVSQGVYDYNRDKVGDRIAATAFATRDTFLISEKKNRFRTANRGTFDSIVNFGASTYRSYSQRGA